MAEAVRQKRRRSSKPRAWLLRLRLGRADFPFGGFGLLAGLFVIVGLTILFIPPDHHSPDCGGSNIWIALDGPQGEAASGTADDGCRPLAAADVAGGLLFLVPGVLFAIHGVRSGETTRREDVALSAERLAQAGSAEATARHALPPPPFPGQAGAPASAPFEPPPPPSSTRLTRPSP